MQLSPEGELDSIAQAAKGLQFLFEHNRDKAAMRAIVDALASRPQSPLANAVGKALQSEFSKYNLI
jgi:hypothetical protein